jgi:hypothetical protein
MKTWIINHADGSKVEYQADTWGEVARKVLDWNGMGIYEKEED